VFFFLTQRLLIDVTEFIGGIKKGIIDEEKL
jgi:hypothetical protein